MDPVSKIILPMLVVAALVVYAVWTNDYGLIGFLAGVFAGNLVAVRLGNSGLYAASFWALTVAVVVVGVGLAMLPFMPTIVGNALFAAGLFAALMMPLIRYGRESQQVD